MRLTTTAKSFKISLSSSELSDLVKRLGYADLSEMINEGMTDLIAEVARQLKEKKGIDITEGREDNVPIGVMVINDIMLIEVPKKNAYGVDVDVTERPEERFKSFMEHLKEALENEAKKQDEKKEPEKEEEKEGPLLLFKTASVGDAMRGAVWVKRGWIIRWQGDVYIQTFDYTAGLLEHFEGRISPKNMETDSVIAFIKDGRVQKYDPLVEVGISEEDAMKLGEVLKKIGVIKDRKRKY